MNDLAIKVLTAMQLAHEHAAAEMYRHPNCRGSLALKISHEAQAESLINSIAIIKLNNPDFGLIK